MQALWILDGNVLPLILANNTTFKVNIEALKASIDKATPTNDLENVIDDSRKIFKEQLKHLNSLFIWSMI
jgi:hypothetical protein